MTRENFEKRNFTHQEVTDAIYHSVKKVLESYDLEVLCIKVTSIDDDGLEVLALTSGEENISPKKVVKYNSLWRIPFKFFNMDRWDNYVIQNCACPVREEVVELSVREVFIKYQGMTLEEANQSCKSFFFNAKTFKQKCHKHPKEDTQK